MDASVCVDASGRIEAGVLGDDARSGRSGVPRVVDVGVSGRDLDEHACSRARRGVRRGQAELDIVHPFHVQRGRVDAVVGIRDHEFDGARLAGCARHVVEGERIGTLHAVDEPGVGIESGERAEVGEVRAAEDRRSEDGWRQIRKHLHGDGAAGPGTTVGIGDRDEVFACARSGKNIRRRRRKGAVGVGPGVAHETGVCLDVGRAGIEAHDFIEGGGERIARLGMDRDGGRGLLFTALAVHRGHRDGVGGGDGGEGVLEGRPFKGGSVRETPDEVHGIGGRGGVRVGNTDAHGRVQGDGGSPHGPDGDDGGCGGLATILGRDGQSHRVGGPSPGIGVVAGVLPCAIHDAVAVEVPFPLGDLVPRTGGDVAGVVRELDLIALDDVKREVGGEGHADLDVIANWAAGGRGREIGRARGDHHVVASGLRIAVGVGRAAGSVPPLVLDRGEVQRRQVIEDGGLVANGTGAGRDAVQRCAIPVGAVVFRDGIDGRCGAAPGGVDGGGDRVEGGARGAGGGVRGDRAGR